MLRDAKFQILQPKRLQKKLTIKQYSHTITTTGMNEGDYLLLPLHCIYKTSVMSNFQIFSMEPQLHMYTIEDTQFLHDYIQVLSLTLYTLNINYIPLILLVQSIFPYLFIFIDQIIVGLGEISTMVNTLGSNGI